MWYDDYPIYPIFGIRKRRANEIVDRIIEIVEDGITFDASDEQIIKEVLKEEYKTNNERIMAGFMLNRVLNFDPEDLEEEELKEEERE